MKCYFVNPFQVAEALAEVMGSDFDQQRHWTSYLRSRAGHKPHDPEDSGVSTFTVSDTTGRLSKFLAARGYASETSLAHEPIFHIQVVHSIGPVGSTFNISSDQVEKVSLRILTLPSISSFLELR